MKNQWFALRFLLGIPACLVCASLGSAQITFSPVPVPAPGTAANCSFLGLSGTLPGTFYTPTGIWDGQNFFTDPGGGSTTLVLNFTGPGCAWTVQATPFIGASTVPFPVTISPSSGTSSGASIPVMLTVGAHPSTSVNELAANIAITVNGAQVKLLNVFENSTSCTASIVPGTIQVPASGYSGSFQLTTGLTPYVTDCWPGKYIPPSWISLGNYAPSQNGTVGNPYVYPFTVAANTGPTRSYQITFTRPMPGATILIIQEGAPQVVTKSLPNGAVGVPYSQTLAASGGLPPYSNWTVSSGSLPAGLSLNSSTGVISGTPTAGSASFSVTVRDTTGATSAAQPLSITIVAGVIITTTTLPNGEVGITYAQTLKATGGLQPYSSWTVASGSLPAGLSLNAFNGTIGGPPTASGTSTFSVTVKDSSGDTSAAQPLSITILTPPAVTTTSLPNGTVNSPYSQNLTASGGAMPYSNWTVTSGSLPGGLSLISSSGAITGTPTASGSFSFKVTVTDSLGGTSPAQPLSMTIVTALMVTTTSLPGGEVGIAYSKTLGASGGTQPYSNWTVTSGSLPAGLTLISASGTIFGMPTANGTSSFSVTVKDSLGNTSAAQALSIAIEMPPVITTTSLPSGTAGVAYSQTLIPGGGAPPYANWMLVSGSLPTGLTLNASTGVLSGTPTAQGSPFTFAVTVSDSANVTSAPMTFSLTIGVPTVPITPTVTAFTSIAAGSSVTLTLSSPVSSDVTATLTLTFSGNAAGSGYSDPGLGFSNPTGTCNLPTDPTSTCTTTVTIPANTLTATVPVGLGSVAGVVTVALTGLTETIDGQQQPLALPSPNPSPTITVAPQAPVITAVQIVGVTGSGFIVDIVASSSSRDLTGATFAFTPANGDTLNGATFSYSGSGNPLQTQATSWFTTGGGLSTGGSFNLQVPFTFSGDTSAIGSVSVTLTNSVGTSAAAMGTM